MACQFQSCYFYLFLSFLAGISVFIFLYFILFAYIEYITYKYNSDDLIRWREDELQKLEQRYNNMAVWFHFHTWNAISDWSYGGLSVTKQALSINCWQNFNFFRLIKSLVVCDWTAKTRLILNEPIWWWCNQFVVSW